MKKIIFVFTALLWHNLLSAQQTTKSTVYFQTDAFALSDEAQSVLENVSSVLLSSPDYELRIEAYTDDRGTEAYNQRLAEDRATTVQTFLTQKGIETAKISTKNWGESQSGNQEARQKNRRVDLVITTYRFDDLAALQKRLLQRSERTFTLGNPAQTQEVKATNGTTVIIPSNSFVLPDGSLPKSDISLTVTEALNPSDWILNSLTTMSNGQILQSGGMVKISATADGQELSLADGARLTVVIPTAKTVDSDMQLFYGNHADVKKGSINWQNTQTGFRQTVDKKTFNIKVSPELKEHFKNLKVPKVYEPVFPQNIKLPAKPTKPTPPLMPRKPIKPTWEKTLKEHGFELNAQNISNKKLKKLRTSFKNQLANYKRDSTNFEKGYSVYLAKLDQYNQALNHFQSAEKAWNELAKSRIKLLLNYENQVYYYLYLNNLRSTIKVAANRMETEAQNLQRFVTKLNQDNLNRSLLGYHISKRQSQKDSKRSEPREEFFQQSRYRLSEREYVEALGLDFVKSAAFYTLEGRAIVEMQQFTTLEKNIDSILVSIGLKAISDSLQIMYNQKELEAAKTPQEKQQVVSAYIADIQQLGWINVDKFAKMNGERAPLTIQETDEASIYVTIKSINSILPAWKQHSQHIYQINDLPKGTKVTVVGVKIKDGMVQLALQDAIVGETPPFQLNYKNMTMNALGNELKRLNG